MGQASNRIRKAQRRAHQKAYEKTKQNQQTSFSGTSESGTSGDSDTTTVHDNEDQVKKTGKPFEPVKKENTNLGDKKNGATNSDDTVIIDDTQTNNTFYTDTADNRDTESVTNEFKEPAPKSSSEAAEIKGKPDPDDRTQEDDEKFDIQQGDFIDFLMKDVVLATVALCGRRVSSCINVALYKVTSEIYHKGKDWIIDVYNAYKEIRKKNKEHQNYVDECAKNGYITKNHIEEAKKADNEETAKIYEQHNKEMKNARRKLNSAKVYSKFVEDLMKTPNNNAFFEKCHKDENGDYYWIYKEEGSNVEHKILVNSNNPNSAIDTYAKKFLELQDGLDKGTLPDDIKQQFGITQTPIPEAEKEELFKKISTVWSIVIEDAATMDAEATIFAANMATAQMLKDGANAADRESYFALYKAQYCSLAKRLRQGEKLKGIKTTQDLLDLSQEAAKKSIEQNEKENGLSETNESLQKINDIIQENNIDDNSNVITLQQEANKTAKKRKKLNDAQQNMANATDTLNCEMETYGQTKQRLKNVRDGLDLSNVRDNAKTDAAKKARLEEEARRQAEAKRRDIFREEGGRA